jgi:hypothetical protein
MKKTITETVERTEEIVVSLTCNCCGKTYTHDDVDMGDITNIDFSFGYGSRFDLQHWDFDICDDCIEAWVKTFKHPMVPQHMDCI